MLEVSVTRCTIIKLTPKKPIKSPRIPSAVNFILPKQKEYQQWMELLPKRKLIE